MAEDITLVHTRSPGDIVVMTALVRDLAILHPGRFNIHVATSCMSLWDNNPYVIRGSRGRRIKLDYGEGIERQKHETVHFISYFHRDFVKQTGVAVKPTLPRGDIHLSEIEKNQQIVNGRYWVMLAGGKSDAPVKVWRADYFQAVVNYLAKHGIGVVQLGSREKSHWHHPLQGTVDLVGRTNLRQMLSIINQADGVICGITAAMHMAAALQRPCVVIGAGREAWWWEAYVQENRGFDTPGLEQLITVPHRYLHTIGLLPCCERYGCWKNKIVKTGNDKSVCVRPSASNGQIVPQCMDMITPEMVETAVLSYYYDGTLEPLPGTQLASDIKLQSELSYGTLRSESASCESDTAISSR